MIIPDEIYQTNQKLFVSVQPKNACKLEFADHLWLPFLDQPQSDIVFFAIITFKIGQKWLFLRSLMPEKKIHEGKCSMCEAIYR